MSMQLKIKKCCQLSVVIYLALSIYNPISNNPMHINGVVIASILKRADKITILNTDPITINIGKNLNFIFERSELLFSFSFSIFSLNKPMYVYPEPP